MAQLIALNNLSIREYDDGSVTLQWGHQDPRMRLLRWSDPWRYEQSLTEPLTVAELALMAAAERVAADLGYQPELPW